MQAKGSQRASIAKERSAMSKKPWKLPEIDFAEVLIFGFIIVITTILAVSLAEDMC